MKDININIIIAGLGNVGSNVVKTILDTSDLIKLKSNVSFNIIGISAKNRIKKRIFNPELFNWYDDPLGLIKIENCDVLIELIGEEKGLSFELVKKALEKKINVITANKALLAIHGSELFKIAEKNNVLLLYEAAVGGGIPIIKTIKNNIFLNNIKKISGILNGTTNYILTTMSEENLDFKEALSLAQSKGYTTPNEAELDIGGFDSAHKLTLLSTICFGSEINFKNNIISGIYDIKINDIINAKKLGYKIKLISESLLIEDKIYSVTGPKLININNPLANVDGVLNAINIETDQLTSLFLEGEGAGGKATASSIISDLYEIALSPQSRSLGYHTDKLKKFKKLDALVIETPYYIRIMTKDITGVLSKITSFFNDLNISIEKILQLPDTTNKEMPIPIIISTHPIKKDKLIKAIHQISKLEFILEKIITIPIDKT